MSDTPQLDGFMVKKAISNRKEHQNMYIVKLTETSEADPDQVADGHLGTFGQIKEYTRGEAIKKARMFNGKIVPVKGQKQTRVPTNPATKPRDMLDYYVPYAFTTASGHTIRELIHKDHREVEVRHFLRVHNAVTATPIDKE